MLAETVASSRLGLSKTWHIFYHKTWITVTGREAAWAWPRAGEGAHNAKFTHQHNTVPSKEGNSKGGENDGRLLIGFCYSAVSGNRKQVLTGSSESCEHKCR